MILILNIETNQINLGFIDQVYREDYFMLQENPVVVNPNVPRNRANTVVRQNDKLEYILKKHKHCIIKFKNALSIPIF